MARRNPWLAKDEIEAAKRWFVEQAPHYDLEGAIVLGDDLYGHQPYCELLLARGLNFILVCKPDSHPTLYEYLALYPPEELTLRRCNGRHGEIYHYRYATKPALERWRGCPVGELVRTEHLS